MFKIDFRLKRLLKTLESCSISTLKMTFIASLPSIRNE